MPFYLVRNDITRMGTDAIVNAANEHLMHGGGVASAIADAAGRGQMDAASAQVAPCPTGNAVWTPAFALPARYVIHAVGPIWRGGEYGEAELLERAYLSALNVARQLGCQSVAFPLLSAGTFGFPQDDAFQIAVDTIEAFLETGDMDVYLVLFGSHATEMGLLIDPELSQFIDDAYAREHEAIARSSRFHRGRLCDSSICHSSNDSASPASPAPFASPASSGNLDDFLEHLDTSFSDTVFALIDAKGLTDPQVYKRVHMSRQAFAKLRQPGYHPRKPTAIVLAIALELDYHQTQELLARAGYTLSPSSMQDRIVEFFIRRGIFDIAELNHALWERDLPLLQQ